MADVAQKLEQLEMMMSTAQEVGISHLASDPVHYDSTDLYGWVQTMLTELNNSPDSLDPSVLSNSQQIDDEVPSGRSQPPYPAFSTMIQIRPASNSWHGEPTSEGDNNAKRLAVRAELATV